MIFQIPKLQQPIKKHEIFSLNYYNYIELYFSISKYFGIK